MDPPVQRRKCGKCLALLAFLALLGIGGLGHMVTLAVQKVLSGQGGETYRTVWLVEFNYVGFLVVLAVGLVVLIVGAIFSLREWWLWRSFERKYAGPTNDA